MHLPRIRRSPKSGSDSPVVSGCTRRATASHGVLSTPYLRLYIAVFRRTTRAQEAAGPVRLPEHPPIAHIRERLAGGLRLHTAHHGHLRRYH